MHISNGLLPTGHDGQTDSCHAVIMWAMASQINGVFIVWSTVCSSADQTKYQSSALQVLCEGNPQVTGAFPSQRASNVKNGSIWWRHLCKNGHKEMCLVSRPGKQRGYDSQWPIVPWKLTFCLAHQTLNFRGGLANSHDIISNRYRKTSNISRTLVGNKIVDHSDVVGTSPVGAAPTTSSFSTWHLVSRDSAKKAARQYENLLSVWIWCDLY